jgi:hypothetical protein
MRGVSHPARTIEEALELVGRGLSDYDVARRLGVPRATVQNWRRTGPPTGGTRRPLAVASRPEDDRVYAYLLGMYLGDGWLGHHGRTTALSFKLDARYPAVIGECASAMHACVPGRVQRLPTDRGAVRLYAYAGNWRGFFPQHGPGRKHERKIELVPWQLEITRLHTGKFIRGLIHSDGSRCINRFSVKLPSGRIGRYAYPRYFFTNYSADIRQIFCDHCDLLGIHWTQSNARNISISHRESVAILDSFVGPKS